MDRALDFDRHSNWYNYLRHYNQIKGMKIMAKKFPLTPHSHKKLLIISSIGILMILGITIFFMPSINEKKSQDNGAPISSQEWLTNYYDAAVDYVSKNYQIQPGENLDILISFLNQIKLRNYEENIFEGSEASAMLEWLLEGAGFNAKIAISSYVFKEDWIIVKLPNGDNYAIEPLCLTDNFYHPPGIMLKENAIFEWDNQYAHPTITLEFCIMWPKPINYYDPYILLPDSFVLILTPYYDWWNAPPYNEMEPFSFEMPPRFR